MLDRPPPHACGPGRRRTFDRPCLCKLFWNEYVVTTVRYEATLIAYLVNADSTRPLIDTRSLKTLLDITSASLCTSAAEYHLQPTVLIQGPRGTGKTTVAMQTANEFGLHFLEVLLLLYQHRH